MERREFLTRFGLTAAGISALGGCTERTLKEGETHPPLFDELYDEEEVDLPTRRKFEIAEEGVLEAEGTTLTEPEEFRAYLEERNLDVESLEERDERGERFLDVEYAPSDLSGRGVLYELGVVAGGYAALVEGGFEAAELDGRIRTDGDVFGEFRIVTVWATEYLEGKLTAAKYAGTVADTLESSV